MKISLVITLKAQDYQISFTGEGESNILDSVIVENLTHNTLLKIKGTDILHLKGTVSISETVKDNENARIVFYPNPTTDYTCMQFYLPDPGETLISVFDISGRETGRKQELLSNGKHTYRIRLPEKGLYVVRIVTGKYFFSGKLISSCRNDGNFNIEYENTLTVSERKIDSKSTNEEKVMQYNTGDRLKLTGKSGKFSTVMTDVPASDKSIAFNFITCTDGEGNNYPIVEIGAAKSGRQIFMAKNLYTTLFSNGEPIPKVYDAFEWAGLFTPAVCDYDNTPGNGYTYGKLYNWYAVKDSRNICPVGWHVPTYGDLVQLMNYLGGESVSGCKLKESGTKYWDPPNAGATNESGFSGLPGGMRESDGTFHWKGRNGYWWSSTQASVAGLLTAYFRGLLSETCEFFFIDPFGLRYGLSVRCLKD